MTGLSRAQQQHPAWDLTRSLGPFEHLIWSTDQWTPRHFVLVARVEGGPISVDRLHRAFLAVQRRHPALRTAIKSDPHGSPCFVPTEFPIQLCIAERVSDTQWRNEVELQLQYRFEAARGPLLRATLVRGESVSELILAAHHSIGDGISAMFLVRDLLESLEGHELEQLPARPCLEDFFGGEPETSAGPSSSFNGIARLEKPGQPQVTSVDIEPRELETLLSRCRDERTTIQGALMAAVVSELRDVPVPRCLAPVSVRHLCPPITDDFGLYIASGVAGLERGPDFWSLARSAREEVMSALRPEVLRKRSAGMESLLAQERAAERLYQEFRRQVIYSAVLSNLGRFPHMARLRRFQITAIYPVLNVELEPLIAVATAGGRMALTLTSDGSVGTEWLASIVRRIFNQCGAR